MNCQHFFITFEASTPRGCKLYQIKSRELPSQIVRLAGGGECLGYKPKIKKEEKAKERDLNDPSLW